MLPVVPVALSYNCLYSCLYNCLHSRLFNNCLYSRVCNCRYNLYCRLLSRVPMPLRIPCSIPEIARLELLAQLPAKLPGFITPQHLKRPGMTKTKRRARSGGKFGDLETGSTKKATDLAQDPLVAWPHAPRNCQAGGRVSSSNY